MNCKYCNNLCKKAGKQQSGRQKYYCLQCNKYQQACYVYHGCEKGIEESIIKHVKRSNGIRDIAYLLAISPVTVIHKIRKIAMGLESTFYGIPGKSYEIDELHTYVGNKDNAKWLIYGIEKASRKVVDIVVGRRTRENIQKITDKILRYAPKKIYTDKLNIYPGLIDRLIHKSGRYLTNRIERMNLTFRTHLKRLSRKTICYSKKSDMLEACIKIYVWV